MPKAKGSIIGRRCYISGGYDLPIGRLEQHPAHKSAVEHNDRMSINFYLGRFGRIVACNYCSNLPGYMVLVELDTDTIIKLPILKELSTSEIQILPYKKQEIDTRRSAYSK